MKYPPSKAVTNLCRGTYCAYKVNSPLPTKFFDMILNIIINKKYCYLEKYFVMIFNFLETYLYIGIFQLSVSLLLFQMLQVSQIRLWIQEDHLCY